MIGLPPSPGLRPSPPMGARGKEYISVDSGVGGPEDELLLCCARTALDTESAERIRALLRENIDWSTLLQTALWHGVMPLLHRSLHTTCPDAVPKPFLEQLRGCFYANAGHNTLLRTELLRLLQLLESHGIPTLPYKGAVLAVSAHGNLALRQFGDLDILTRKQDILRARDLLVSQGYRSMSPLSATRSAAFQRARRVYELLSQDGQIAVELHWAVTSWTFFFPLDPARLWERLETVSLGDTTVRSLAPQDLLLILCVHGAKHHWSKLVWVCDVAELLRAHPVLAWTSLLAQAKKLGARRMLCLGLLLAHELLGSALPKEVWNQIQADPIVPWLAAQVRRRLFTEPHGSLLALDHPAFYFRLRERLRDRVPCALYLTYSMLPSLAKTALLLSPQAGLATIASLRRLFRRVSRGGLF